MGKNEGRKERRGKVVAYQSIDDRCLGNHIDTYGGMDISFLSSQPVLRVHQLGGMVRDR